MLCSSVVANSRMTGFPCNTGLFIRIFCDFGALEDTMEQQMVRGCFDCSWRIPIVSRSYTAAQRFCRNETEIEDSVTVRPLVHKGSPATKKNNTGSWLVMLDSIQHPEFLDSRFHGNDNRGTGMTAGERK